LGTAVTVTAAQGTFGAQTITGIAVSVSAATGVTTTTLGAFGTATGASAAAGSLITGGVFAGTAIGQSTATGTLVARLTIGGAAATVALVVGYFGGSPLSIVGTARNVSVTYSDLLDISKYLAMLELDMMPRVINRMTVNVVTSELNVIPDVVNHASVTPEVVDRMDVTPWVEGKIDMVPETVDRLDLEIT